MSPKEEVELLMNDGMVFAELMLSKHGEFHPFSRALDVGGKIQNVDAFDGREFPPGKEALEFLESGLRVKVLKDKDLAVSIFSNVTVRSSETNESIDAIQVGLEHSSGYAVNVYFPYEITPEGPVFGELFANSRSPAVFVGGAS